ncbi:MAG: DUF885 domain-containing protein [Candidatus Limnocylindrales bacterium]
MSDDVNALAADYYDFRHRMAPTSAHLDGDYRFAGDFEDPSRIAEDAQLAEDRQFARRAEAIDESGLNAQDRISREMIAWDATSRADLLSSRMAEYTVNPIQGIQAMLPVYMPKLSIPSIEIAEAMTSKLRGIGLAFREMADRLRAGAAGGRTPAAFAVEATISQLDAWLALAIERDPLLNISQPAGMFEPDAWRSRLRAVIADEVRPGVLVYRNVLRDEILPRSRPDEHVGLTWLADGEAAYAAAIRFFTTVDKSPAEIHEIGRQQVESLAGEYRQLGPAVTGSDDLATILEALRSDPALHHETADQVVADAKAALDKAKRAMGDWFGILPKADCDVESATSGAIAYYFSPALDGSRGGTFFMNTSDPNGWGRFQVASTAYHEGIPGHHLQLAISTELTTVPDFRKHAFIAAFGEGWGLYAERLADEMGLYATPLERMGMLSADSMRACRLVVDTGMHALGWSRRQAIGYMLENSPMRENHITAEIDRYVVNPGQALAYMIGRLEIQRIRAAAEARLGDRFEIKAFHDTVLGSGSLPLPILDRHVNEWLAAQASPA